MPFGGEDALVWLFFHPREVLPQRGMAFATITPHQRRAVLPSRKPPNGIVRWDGAESMDQAAAPPARKPFRGSRGQNVVRW